MTSQTEYKIKCVLGMLGVDCHHRGIRVLSTMLRDYGMEVVYVGEYNTPETLVQSAVAEDADVIGISFFNGAHRFYMEQIMQLVKENHLDDVLVIIGGLIYEKDIPLLKSMGVAEVFGSGSRIEDIVNYIKAGVAKRKAPQARIGQKKSRRK